MSNIAALAQRKRRISATPVKYCLECMKSRCPKTTELVSEYARGYLDSGRPGHIGGPAWPGSTGDLVNRSILARSRRVLVTLVSVAVVSATFPLAGLQAAADTAPADPSDPRTPPTVAVDALPTVQVDGVVWAQTVVGNTVYAVGSFSTARPAGSASGVNTVTRSNALAYDLVTGQLNQSWAPQLNGQGMAVAASPDGSRIYIGGDFTSINGQIRNRVAAVDAVTGELVGSFQPKPDARVRALAVTDSTVYIGGLLTAVSGTARSRVAAVSASDGSLLPWAPNAQGGSVYALALSPDNSKVVIGGSFTSLNGSTNPGNGLAMVDPVTAAHLPFAANSVITNSGPASAITSLTATAEGVWGTGYGYQQGPTRLEGAFRANWNGDLDWLEDCHGDSYGVQPFGDAVYVVSHAHFCQNVGGFPQLDPPYRALAWSRTATGVVSTNTQNNYKDYAGQPAPSMLHWFPTMSTGSYTGQDQAAWTVTAAGDYLLMGGEFPTVNNKPQQGLVRFTVKSKAANKFGPAYSDASINPVASVASDGSVRLSWTANVDRDNKSLRYDVFRDGDTTNPVATLQADSLFWSRPALTAVDRTVAANTTYSYQVLASDAFGNKQLSASTTVTTGSSAPAPWSGQYSALVAADAPSDYWRLGESGSASTINDWIGTRPGSRKAGVSLGAPGALLDDPNTAASFSGTSTGYVSTTNRSGPNTFTVEAWFKTTTDRGGKIVGYGSATTGNSSTNSVDRHIYMQNDGRLSFGTYFSNSARTVTSPNSYNDGAWHQVAGTVGPNGMELFVDGSRVADRPDAKGGRSYNGNWRIGGETLTGRPKRPTSDYFNGVIDDVSVYPNVLSAARLAAHYAAGTQPAPNDAPTASFTAASDGKTATFDASASTDPDGTISSYSWDFGDGESGSGATVEHEYAEAGTYSVTLTVTDNRGATDQETTVLTIVDPESGVLATDSFSRTTSGGWGSADVGGEWTRYGNASLFQVSDGGGRMVMATPGSGPRAVLGSVSSSDSDITASVVLDKNATGGGNFVSIAGRVVGTAEYRTKVKIASNGALTLYLTKVTGGAETTLQTVNLPAASIKYEAGSKLWIRMQAAGVNATELKASTWLDGTTPPATWQISSTDNTADLQAPGGVGLVSYLAGSATNAPIQVSFDDLQVTKTGN